MNLKQLLVVPATLFIIGSGAANVGEAMTSGALAQEAGGTSQPPEERTREFPPPWTVEQIQGGYKVKDAQGRSLAYVYGRGRRADADTLTMDEARGIASNIAKLPNFLAAQP